MVRPRSVSVASLSIGHDDREVILNSAIVPPLPPAASDARGWAQILVRYRAPSLARSIVELIITARPLILLWSLMWVAIDLGYWFCLLLAVPAAGFLVRLFMIQHDCGHGAFFHRRSTNDWVGRVIGVLTLTPYDFWRRKHAIHHATSGNLERRGIGDVDTLTVDEYLARSRWGRLRYRLYRHPFVMFGVGPAYLFILEHRLPVDLMRGGWQPWFSTMATNIATLAAAIIWFVGIGHFCCASTGHALPPESVVLCPHQLENTAGHDRAWPARGGASRQLHYAPAGHLARFTANIGVHHPSSVQSYPLPTPLVLYTTRASASAG